MESIQIGIIGCGGIAQAKHIPNLLKIPGARIAALADMRGKDALEEVAGRFALRDTACYADYRELLADKNIDAVHVCTPNGSHAAITIEALTAGKHVLCEKPMATGTADAKRMVDAAAQSGKTLSICSNNRFTPAMWALKALCAQGELGDIYFAKAHCVRRRGVPTWGQFLDVESQGGGPVIDLGVHALDLALWMMDNYKPRLVLGRTFDHIGKRGSAANPYGSWNPAEFTVEDSGFGMVVMENGATIYLEAAWALNTRDERPVGISLCGTRAGADMTDGLVINTEEHGRLVDKQIVLNPRTIPFYQPKEVYGPELELAKWIDCLREGKPPVTLPHQMFTVSRIIDGFYQSARTGCPVTLSEGGGV